MDQWLTSLSAWLAGLAQSLLEVLYNLFSFLVVALIDLIGAVIVAALNLLSLPQEMAGYSLTSLVAGLPAGVGWFLGAVRLPEAVGIIVAAVLVRLSRKIITLFQW